MNRQKLIDKAHGRLIGAVGMETEDARTEALIAIGVGVLLIADILNNETSDDGALRIDELTRELKELRYIIHENTKVGGPWDLRRR